MEYGKGVIGIASHFLGRYREFDFCLGKLKYPHGSIIDWQIGINVALNYNNMIRTMLLGDYEWVWILGDDHIFNPNLLNKLLEHDVDIVVPLCLRAEDTAKTVLHKRSDESFKEVELDFFNGKSGLVNITDYTIGNAGMLIKRHVAENIDAPWFENSNYDKEIAACDLIFADKIKDSGFKLYIDTDSPLGHITHMAIWPVRDKNNIYSSDLRTTHELFVKGDDISWRKNI